MFRTSPAPSSGGTTVFIRHFGTCYSVQLTVWYAGCILHTVVPPDDGTGEARNM